MLMTMGDPAGIGPEIVLAAAARHPERWQDLVVVGDFAVMQAARERLAGQSPLPLPPLRAWDGTCKPGSLAVWQAGDPRPLPSIGQVSADAGRMAADAIELAARQVLAGAGQAVVTAPIHKEALAAAGIGFPGHTEFLQALAAEHLGRVADEVPVRMMLSCPGLRTVLVTIHVALRRAIDMLSIEEVWQTLQITDRSLRIEGRRPRIAVAGLNPHAGEGGLFGREEIEIIAPAVARAQQMGMDVSGPHPPDTVFMRARQGQFDVVIAMYHDQGLIPVKLLGLDGGVNTTLGLPFVRTSPDHGTAFDLAGTGRADPSSLIAAWDAAMEMTAA
jgi:4-hydroxythreonine-4-phosphate dehydrogenase